MNKKLAILIKIISFFNMLVIIMGFFLLLCQENKINPIHIYKIIVCGTFTILLYIEGDKIKELRECVFEGKEKRIFIFLLVVGILMCILQNGMYFLEISGRENGISCTISAIAAYTLFNSLLKMIKKQQG